MAVVKRGNSQYWYIQFQMNGRTFIKSSRTTNKKAAEQMEADWRSKLHAQHYLGVKPSITLGVALDSYCRSKEGTPFYSSIRSSAGIVGQLLGRALKLEDITSHHLERLKRARIAQGRSMQTIRHNLNVVRGAIKAAKAAGYAVADVVFPSAPTSKPSLRYLTPDEEGRLFEELDPMRQAPGIARHGRRHEELVNQVQDNRDLVALLLDTGARYNEIASIEWRRIDLEKREIHLWRPKVQNESIIFMTERVHAILSRRFTTRSGPYVFTNKAGGPRGYAAESIRKAMRRAGLAGVKIHTLRHTHASRLIQNGLTIYEVKEVLGHTDIKTTMRYAHLESRVVTAKARDVINALNTAQGHNDGFNVIIDINQAEQLRHDVVTIAQLHHRSAAIFLPRAEGVRALLRGAAEDLVYVDVARSAFAETLQRLFEYGSSTARPAFGMELTDWVASHAASKYLMALLAAGHDGKLSPEETCAVDRCLAICRQANERFKAANGWSFIT